MSWIVVTAIAIPSATAVVMLAMVLHFSRALVEKTGDTSCLRDVATLLRAFGFGPGGLLSALSRIFRRSG